VWCGWVIHNSLGQIDTSAEISGLVQVTLSDWKKAVD